MERTPNNQEKLSSMRRLQDYLFLNNLGGGITNGEIKFVIPSIDMRLEQIREYFQSFDDVMIEEIESEPHDEHEKGKFTVHTFVISQK